MMAANFAAARGAETTLLERTADGGRKILISGGGRCNVLPARVDERRFVTDSSPHSLRKLLRAWPLAEQVAFFERELGVPLAEEAESAKLFPASNRARDVRDALLALAARRGARFRPHVTVTGLASHRGGWRVTLERGEPIEADAVVVASGGLSVPKTGSDGTGLAILERLGHVVHPTYPALTPVTDDGRAWASLAGVSLPVTVTATSSARTATATGGFLFTHHGYSGPSVLDVSHVLVRARTTDAVPARLQVQWTARDRPAWTDALRPDGLRSVGGVVRQALPERLADALMAAAGVPPATRLAQLRKEDRSRLIDALVHGPLPWTGDEGYKKAEVTGGGVSLAEVHPATLASRRCPGLHLCGELLDAFGPIGGYNFLWAWATGRTAGIGAATSAGNGAR
jgi:predicted Rossmann fold flavoprotein